MWRERDAGALLVAGAGVQPLENPGRCLRGVSAALRHSRPPRCVPKRTENMFSQQLFHKRLLLGDSQQPESGNDSNVREQTNKMRCFRAVEHYSIIRTER